MDSFWVPLQYRRLLCQQQLFLATTVVSVLQAHSVHLAIIGKKFHVVWNFVFPVKSCLGSLANLCQSCPLRTSWRGMTLLVLSHLATFVKLFVPLLWGWYLHLLYIFINISMTTLSEGEHNEECNFIHQEHWQPTWHGMAQDWIFQSLGSS